MNLSGKKLTTAILAGLMGATMFGGSVFAEVSDQEFNEVRQGVNSNTQRISQLENAQSAAKDYSTDIAANKTAIADEATARTDADTQLDTRITNVKEYLENQTAANYVSKTDAAVQDGAVAKAGNTIGENVTNLDGALAQETAARIGADAAQDKVIKQVNDNLVNSVNTINKNVADGFNALSAVDLQEAQTRAAADKTLQDNINAEATARADADTQLDTRITNVKEYLENQTAANYVSKSDAAVQDGAVVKADKTIGENVTKLDGALAKETAARIGADAAQDKVIKQVNDNLVSSVDTINKNIGTITNQLNKNDLAEAQARDAADQTLQKNIDAETTARQTDVANLQKNITDSLTNQGKINETLTTAVQNNSKAIVDSAKNLEKHLSDTDGRVDKANAEIHTNAGNIAQNKQDIADIQNTLKGANAFASADATKAATQAASDATAAAENANNVANGLKDRVDLISNNQNVTSESDLIKKDQSVGQNLTNVDTALHKEIADRIGADAAQDKVIKQVNENLVSSVNTINKNIGTITDQLNKNDLAEAQTRAAADKTLQDNIDAEATARDQAVAQERAERKGADAAQDKVIKQVNDNLVSSVDTINKNIGTITDQLNKNDLAEAQTRAAADKTLQDNIDAEATARDQAVAQERAERKGADAAQDKVIKQVNDNLVSSVNTINKNVADGFNALSAVDLQEAQTRAAADQTLQNQIANNAQAIGTTKDGNYVKSNNSVGQNLNALDAQVGQNSANINQLFSDYSSMKTDINKVGARSAALAGLHPLDFDPANKLNFAVASGSFKGENSVALGAFYRPNENVMFSAASTMGDSDNAYTFGLSFKIGPSSAKTKTTSPDAEELYKVVGQLQDQLAAQQKEIEQLKAEKAAK
ncbi:YadA C-terminal domain-containing protein [Megasphaera sp. UBA4382]|uniref:YadA C-terminal domain-containing protein n=2 Tax=unclassified Megasphaera TaxID=2626256 RepID=UPI0025C0F7FF|nr:YadA C-terminal domain-containing protein [Megasphaera sp. UBA4382]